MEDVINNHGFAGFAVGRVGEASREVEDFVKTMADIGTTHGPRTHVLGPVSLNAAKGVLTRRYMSRLAMARWKGLADLTIDRASFVGVKRPQTAEARRRAAAQGAAHSIAPIMTDAAWVDRQGPALFMRA